LFIGRALGSAGSRQRLEAAGMPARQGGEVGAREVEIVEIALIQLAQLVERAPVA
jgi:hypothetical protein